MRHAYLITINNNFRILELLMSFLDDTNIDFYIMVDKKVKIPLDKLITKYPSKSKFVEVERICINWGGYSQIQAELNLLKTAVKYKYDYYHYLQGSDFPIKSPNYIKNFFEKYNGKEFVKFEQINYDFAKFKCNYFHLFVDNRFYRNCKALKILNHGFVKFQKLLRFSRKNSDLYHGSALFLITHSCAKYIVSIENDIKKRYKYTLAADEVFMQTEIYNSKFKNSIYDFEEDYSNLFYIDWSKRKGSSPYTFNDEDKWLINLPENYLFARKFDESNMDIINFLYDNLS